MLNLIFLSKRLAGKKILKIISNYDTPVYLINYSLFLVFISVNGNVDDILSPDVCFQKR